MDFDSHSFDFPPEDYESAREVVEEIEKCWSDYPPTNPAPTGAETVKSIMMHEFKEKAILREHTIKVKKAGFEKGLIQGGRQDAAIQTLMERYSFQKETPTKNAAKD